MFINLIISIQRENLNNQKIIKHPHVLNIKYTNGQTIHHVRKMYVKGFKRKRSHIHQYKQKTNVQEKLK